MTAVTSSRYVLSLMPLFIGSLLLQLGCGDDASGPEVALVLQPSELCGDHSDAAIATFEDASLEAAISQTLDAAF